MAGAAEEGFARVETGATVQVSSAGSYYDAGEITGYRWTFDGDATVDLVATDSRTTHTYTAPFTGIASVTVLTGDGHEGTVTAAVDVRADAPLVPGAPAGLTATPGVDHGSLNLAWQPPADTGGAPHRVHDRDPRRRLREGRGIGGRGRGRTGVTVDGLAAGAYTVRVRAYNDAGIGAAAEQHVDLSLFTFAVLGRSTVSQPRRSCARLRNCSPAVMSTGRFVERFGLSCSSRSGVLTEMRFGFSVTPMASML